MPISTDDENCRVDGLIGDPCPVLEETIESHADLAGFRACWEQLEPIPVLVENREQGVDQSWAGLDVRSLLRGEQSAGRFAVHSIVLAPGTGLPAHYHEDTHTYLLVEEGDVEFSVGAAVEQVGQYSLGYVPPRTRHSLRCWDVAPLRSALAPARTASETPAGRSRGSSP